MQPVSFRLRVAGSAPGDPLRWDVDLDAPSSDDRPGGIPPDAWVDPDSWSLRGPEGDPLPLHVAPDTLDGRRFTLRWRAAAGGEHEVTATAALHPGPRPAPEGAPRPQPLVGAGEALTLDAPAGDLHVGLQTAVQAVDWYGRGRLDLLVTCHLHEGGAFVYAALDEPDGAGRPLFRRAGRVPGFGEDGQGYSARLRAVDFAGDGRFDLLECGRHGVRRYRNAGVRGAPAFAPPAPLLAGGRPLDLGAQVQSVCPADLGDGRVSLIAGTNDWSGYWPADVGAWQDLPGYRPYTASGAWRGGPLRGRLFLLPAVDAPADAPADDAGAPALGAPIPLCHPDGTPLEVYGLAGPAPIPAAEPGAPFDLLVSDFLDRLWYFRATGPAGPDGAPRFHPRVPVRCPAPADPASPLDRTPGPPPAPPADYPPAGRLPDELVLPTCMHALSVVAWPAGGGGDGDGDGQGAALDLLVGAEDGYVRALRLTGRDPDGVPVVQPPARLQERGARLSVGAKACPDVVDWERNGRPDLLLGNAAGQVLLARNLGREAGAGPVFGAPEPFLAAGYPLWLMAGAPGTIQGPSEVKWGYINPAAGPWPLPAGAGATAIVCGDALGNNTVYLRRLALPVAPGALGSPSVSRGRRLHVLRAGRWEPLVTRWRCRPQLVDWGDGETVYLQVDEAGHLACYRILADGPDAEDGTPRVQPLDVLRHPDGAPVQLDADTGGRVGRIKLAVADWDGDGLPDLLAGSSGNHPPGRNTLRKATVWLLRNLGAPGRPVLAPPEALPLEGGAPARFGGHSCVPAPCHLDRLTAPEGQPQAAEPPGPPDLLVGSENGRIFAFRRAYAEGRARILDVRAAVGAP